jgi:heme-degrading monooxygenase HmoA
MIERDANQEPIVLINVFSVPLEREGEFLERWNQHAIALIDQPGFVDTKLHRSLGSDAQFSFINVARWESTEKFRQAVGRPGFRTLGGLGDFGSAAALYGICKEY